MRIQQEIIDRIKANPALMGNICAAFNKTSIRTVERWLKDNDENGLLTAAAALKLIREHLNVTDSQILQEELINS